MKAQALALLMSVPVTVFAQSPISSHDGNTQRPTPARCLKNPTFPGCPAQPGEEATTNSDIPPGGWCDPVRQGCPTYPHIRTCDNCSAQAMQNKATLAAAAEGNNYAYVVNRPARQVRYYWIFVTFNSNGVHKSVVELAIQGEGPQVMKDALQAAADVNIWLKSFASITEEDLENAGINLPYDNGFEYASDWPTSDIYFNRAIEDYMNRSLFSQAFLDRAADTLIFFVNDIASSLADTAVDANSGLEFVWSDGSSVVIEYTTTNIFVDELFDASADRTTLNNASGELIPPSLSGFGIGSGGGETERYDAGDDPTSETAFRNYLQGLAGSNCSVTTNCFEDAQGHYQCIGTVEC